MFFQSSHVLFIYPDSPPIFTIVYTDSSSSFHGASDSSNGANEFLSTFSPASASEVGSSLPNSEATNIVIRSTNSKPNCKCDNASPSSIVVAADDHFNFAQRQNSVRNSAVNFVPNEPVFDSTKTIIFVITPTYTRPSQMADMTRLANTLRLVPDVFWIVAEDAHTESK